MLDFNQNKENCTGCAACYSICPVHCIAMNRDEEGFLYPEASSACIHCKLCEIICPIHNNYNLREEDNRYPKIAIAAVTKDYRIWYRSSSGGAFSEICRVFTDDNTFIYGAAWDGLSVHHVGVSGFNNISSLCKSKYISSAIEDTFIEIKNHLRQNKKVIFCGCPCQVDGLKHYLRKDYETLLTIDLICHGQGSPAVFIESIKVMEAKLKDKILSYEFRTKRKAFETDHLARVTGKKRQYYLIKDPYIQLFLKQNALRPSCGKNCRYRNVNRPGDITIADCKGLYNIFPDLSGCKQNYSTIVSNSHKGERIIKLLYTSMNVRPCSIDDVIKYNPLFAQQTWFSNDRDSFFADFVKSPSLAIDKWTEPMIVSKYSIFRKVYDILPNYIRHYIYEMYRSIHKIN